MMPSLQQRQFTCWRFCSLFASLVVVFGGCGPKTPPPTSGSVSGANLTAASVVSAQGQILPESGFVGLAGTPGDIVEDVLVAVGDEVDRGAKLLMMKSERIHEKQVQSLTKRLAEAVREKGRAEARAARQVQAAQLKLEHISEQKLGLERQLALLVLAEEQVAASKTVLSKLKSIADDRMTSEFVGQLEIDRQQIAVREAELKYAQQEEALVQATEDLVWAEKAANAEQAAAIEMLEAARDADAKSVIESEIATLQTQNQVTLIKAPDCGTIVAINASPGEASIQMPLVEMANLNRMVCEVEINEMDAASVSEGQKATIESRAFGDKVLTGYVLKKYSMVGRPQLKPLNPLARADYRTVTAVVLIDDGDSTELAKNWLQLQVEVKIGKEMVDAKVLTTTKTSTADCETAEGEVEISADDQG